MEVEKSTSIYSGILRLTDLAYSIVDGDEVFYIIIPDNREKDVRMQLSRPSIKSIKVPINYILFSDLRQNCDALCKFGESHHILKKIAKTVYYWDYMPAVNKMLTGITVHVITIQIGI